MAFDRVRYMKKYHKKWYNENKKHLLKAMKQYSLINADEIKQYKAYWYSKNSVRLRKRAIKNYQRKDPNIRLAYNLKTLYSITIEQYDGMLRKQKRVCAICKKREKQRLSVDHNHKTGKVRGLLCTSCNLGLGHFDSFKLLKSLKLYVRRGESV